MSLDIRFIARKNILCPHCGEVVTTEDVDCVDSGGRGWYPILESLGYYVPYDQRTEENDWYGKDMGLTMEQAHMVYGFIAKNPDLYGARAVKSLIAFAEFEGCDVIVNADW